MRRRFYILFALIMLLSGCGQSGSDSPGDSLDASDSPTTGDDFSDTPLERLALRSTDNCLDLKSRFIDNWAETLLQPYRDGNIRPIALPAISDSRALTLQTAADTPEQVSTTNLQESGVDEADYVKADASGNLYVAHQGSLLIERAFPPSTMTQLAELDLGGSVAGIYLDQAAEILVALVKRQALIYKPLPLPVPVPVPGPVPLQVAPVQDGDIAEVSAVTRKPVVIDRYRPAFDVVVVDVSDKSAPSVSERIRIDGWLVSSRRVGQRLHLLSRMDMYPYRWLQVNAEIQALLAEYRKHFVADDDSAYDEIAAKIRALLLEQIEANGIGEILPRVAYPLLAGNTPQVALDCDAVFAPAVGLIKSGFMTLSSVDIDGANLSQLGLLGNGWLTYATESDFFLAQNSSGWWWSRWQRQQSVIHQLSISDNKPRYVASGLVPGYINNSFSMSYRDDTLRVATTTTGGPFFAPSIEPANHLLVLRGNGSGHLKTIGAVRGFAPGERIFSARFFHDKAFIVTFRLIDPLFAFDLSQAEDPRIVGELKIPGFSHYIYPIDANTLLTIGRDGDGAGASDDIAVKLFDVSDLANMQLLDNYVPNVGGYSSSSANWDHHAFTYYAPLELLSIPVISYDHSSGDYFSGIIALDIDLAAGRIGELGRVDHQDLLQLNCPGTVWLCGPKSYSIARLTHPNRSVVMQGTNDDYLYSISNIGIKATNLADFDSLAGSLIFPPRSGIGDYYLY